MRGIPVFTFAFRDGRHLRLRRQRLLAGRGDVVVKLLPRSYSPSTIAIKVGQTVEWSWGHATPFYCTPHCPDGMIGKVVVTP